VKFVHIPFSDSVQSCISLKFLLFIMGFIDDNMCSDQRASM